MKSLWDDKQASLIASDLERRVYSSRLLGAETDLVLHGGGNTSVKICEAMALGGDESILYIKGSGWDLATIEAEGFAPVRLDTLLKMAALEQLSDSDMVRMQRSAMTDPDAPTPSVEAILHAIIPFRFVDHTHADAIVTLTNSPGGDRTMERLFGCRVVLVPYVMPGFELAKAVYQIARELDWQQVEGLILMNHGLFTFADDAKSAYEKTIELVTQAEEYLACHTLLPWQNMSDALTQTNFAFDVPERIDLAKVRRRMSELRGYPVVAELNQSELAVHFSGEDIDSIATRGPLTPDHVIRTKPVPAILGESPLTEIDAFTDAYLSYFKSYQQTGLTCLNPAPNYVIFRGGGSASFGRSMKEAHIIRDINNHTFRAILQAEQLGGYHALPPRQIFEVEYWELEQAKLKRSATVKPFAGRIALVSQADHPLALVCIQLLLAQGASVLAVSSRPLTHFDPLLSDSDSLRRIQASLVNSADRQACVESVVGAFGGLDMLLCFADDPDTPALVDTCAQYLQLGWRPCVLLLQQGAAQVPELVAKYPVLIHQLSYQLSADDAFVSKQRLELIAKLVQELLITLVDAPLAMTLQTQAVDED